MKRNPKLIGGELTQQQLKSVLEYRPTTGFFVWTKNASKDLVGKIAGRLSGGYRQIVIHGRTYRAHRLAWFYVHGDWPNAIDHANGNRDDNRLENLRVATPSQNGANMRMPPTNTSGVKGVSRRPNGKFAASITVSGKTHFLGEFKTIESAAEAYLAAAKKFQGEFAHVGDHEQVVLRKIKADPYHPLRFKWGNDDPRLQPLTPDQPVIDRLALNPRNARRLRAVAREQERAAENESFLQDAERKLPEGYRKR